jgi:uncharacterized membrane protein
LKKTENILINTSIAINALLWMLLIFENRLVIPEWLQVAGRLHPMILHFPVVLVIIVVIFALNKIVNPKTQNAAFKTWLVFATILASGTALSGFFLSNEDGYNAEALYSHKWSGIILSFLLLLWSLGFEWINQRKFVSGMAAVASLATVLLAGHWGSSITHGDNFVLAPILKAEEKPAILFDDALVYQDMVRPILEIKCMNCHNENKAKGELIMATEALLVKGGKTGKIWNLETPGFGLMMDRIHLAPENKKHMPPTGKPQLTAEEIFIIEQWLAKGASFQLRVNSLAENDTLRKTGSTMFGNLASQQYDFEAADAGTIQKQNTANRSVYQLAMDVPAVAVDFYGRSQYLAAQLKELLEIKEQVVALNLNKMPVNDAEMSVVGQFKNLRRLNLSFTDITGRGLLALQSLPHLQQLSISGTTLTAKDFSALQKNASLHTIFAWNTKVKDTEQLLVQQQLGNKRIYWGFNGDTITLQLNAPIIENEIQIITSPVELKLKHFLPGVSIRYSLDGTDPDSMFSPVYKEGILINSQGMLKAKAFKKGWAGSSVSQLYFFKNKFKPDSVWAKQQPDNAYKGNGAATLNDNVKGDQNFRNGKWLGYKENEADLFLFFKEPIAASGVTFSSLIDVGSYIMPPQTIEIWGGGNLQNLRILKKIEPLQPLKEMPLYQAGFECNFPTEKVQYIRIIAKPVNKLPLWHRGKGDKGWIFMDEIFVN